MWSVELMSSPKLYVWSGWTCREEAIFAEEVDNSGSSAWGCYWHSGSFTHHDKVKTPSPPLFLVVDRKPLRDRR